MSAVARELAYALQIHPNSPKLKTGSRVLLSSSKRSGNNNDDPDFDLNKELVEVLGGALSIEELNPCDLMGASENENCYDAVILSNILANQKALENKKKIAELLGALLGLLKPGGVAIIRENLEEYSAQLISEVTKFFDVFATSKDNKTLGFNFYGMNQLQDSIYAQSNFLDVFWMLSKTLEIQPFDDKLATYREFLDKTQYTEDNVKSYEWIFGDNFISPGGIEENRRILKYFNNLHPGQKMLDIGVGIGGGARQVAKEFGLHVLGCDLSSNMIFHAFDRNQRDKDHRVEFQIADAMVYKHEPNTFDAVFSRDCIHHIKETEALFKNIYTWLKPGGQVLITMYGKGRGTLQPKFLEYVRQRMYFLKNIDEIQEIARQTGFVNIHAENMTYRFKEILIEERQKTLKNREEFMQKFSKELYDGLVEGWADKLDFIKHDNHNWLLITAFKP